MGARWLGASGAVLELHAHRHRCEPLRDPLGSPGHGAPRSSSTTGATTVRSTRRSPRSTSGGTSSAREGNIGQAGAARPDDAGRRDERPRRARTGARHGDVAVCLFEPALTNIGIVLPDAGLSRGGPRSFARRSGTLLLIDETHTISAGPGGCTEAWGLEPDIVTIGKTLGAGIATGAYGMSEEVSRRVYESTDWKNADVGGSAARWPATRCRSRRCGPRSAR